ncbi:transposase [Paraburkholderia graminis]|nr:transposase [Paraburkholderia graminis]
MTQPVNLDRRDNWIEEMGKPIIDDELWTLIEPLLPPAKPRRFKYPGRKPVPDRAALTGILFVLKTGIRWRDLPAEMGCGSGVSCWRRLRDWQQAGVWDRLHAVLLARLRGWTKSTSRVWSWIRPRFERLGRAKNWSEPHPSSATWIQAPHRHRRQRYADRGNPDWRQS